MDDSVESTYTQTADKVEDSQIAMYRIFFTFITLFTCLNTAWPKTTPQTEIHVILLGQPCLLLGPYDEPTLKAIHGIGPAQIYPNLSVSNFTVSTEQAQKTLDKIRGMNSLPSSLDRYREKLGKRLTGQIAFLSTIETTQKAHNSSNLSQVAKKFLKNQDLIAFEKLLKKINLPQKNTSSFMESMDQIFDFYNDRIEPDPEEEFHRAIKRMNVQYTCSFEETEESTGNSE